MIRICLAWTIIILCAFISYATAQSIVLEVDKDAFICECQPDATNPGGPVTKLFQGPYYVSGHNCFARTASSWDLSSLPAGITITQATIEFKCGGSYGTLTGQMVFYRFLNSWDESTINSNNVPSFTIQDSITRNWPASGQWFSLDVTNFVKFWYEHPDSNFGIYGHCINTTANTGAIAVYSSRYGTSADRPKLTITYLTTDVKSEGALTPSNFRLNAYPNPFNPTTNITYTLDESGWVVMHVTDLNGRIVDRLVQAHQSTGEHILQWNANRFASGMYFVSLVSGTRRAVKKIVLMK